MKIAIRGGHNHGVPGASSILNEVIEDRKVYPRVIFYLKQLGHEVLDVTPGSTSTKAQDLTYGVSKANAWGADYFASIHLNSDDDGEGNGAEVLFQSTKGKEIAERISSRIGELGFRNRGAKPNTRSLYELKQTDSVANIIEVCFLNSKIDTEIYKKVGVDQIAKAIAEGITGQTITMENKPKYTVNYCLEFQRFYNKATQTSTPLAQDGCFGPATEKAFRTMEKLIKGEY